MKSVNTSGHQLVSLINLGHQCVDDERESQEFIGAVQGYSVSDAISIPCFAFVLLSSMLICIVCVRFV